MSREIPADRWRQISQLYHAALAREGGDRAAFLEQTCAGDDPLRREVESLLAQPASADAFLDAHLIGLGARVVSDPGASRLTGRRLGVYQLHELLGAGGMGEVYRARDAKLGRDVAIKILPRLFTDDPDRLARFEREARFLASLNHPNIGAIYGFEEADGGVALVLELVEGETLADRLHRGPLPVAEALMIAQETAEALEAAHEKGIIHRDLKPANIKITPSGTVKVLDFGLAKAAGSDMASPDFSQSPTMTFGGTYAGVILGTAAYMSPEQTRGKPLDKRTDVWAFGCVLHEMLVGRLTFKGETVSDTIAAILSQAPDWSALPATTPATVRRLLRRCLEKDPRRRLHDIADARIEIEEALSGASAAEDSAVADRRRTRNSFQWWVGATLSLIAITTIVVLAWRGRPGAQTSSAAPQFSRILRLTSGPAREFSPAISPDGKWVAYVSNAGGSTNVWVQFVAGGEPANLTAAAGLDVSASPGVGGLDISPDGTRIAVMARTRGSVKAFATWEVPAPLPGVPHKLLDDGFLGMRWAPDGRHITFIRAGSSAGDALWIADADGANRRELIQARGGIHIHWPSWSRDDFIYFIRTPTTIANLDQSDIYRINVHKGTEQPVVSTLRRALHPLPMPNGGGLIYAANPTASELSVWWRPANDGPPQRLTTGAGDYAEPRISADGRSLVLTLYELRQSLARIALASAPATQISAITDGYGGDLDPSIAPNGNRLVFSSTRAGDRHLWTARIDGSEIRPLTSGSGFDDRPSSSPDGQQVAFISDRSGQRAIWIISADGGAPRKVADAAPTGVLSWSPDGRQIVYAASAGDWPGLWTVSVADGQIRRVPTPGAAGEPAWSPTRQLIAYMEAATTGPGFVKLAFVDPAGRPQYTTLAPAPDISAGFANGMPAWSPDGKRLAVVSQNTNLPAAIWIIEPDSPNPSYRKVIELPIGPRIRGMVWTRDGSGLIIGEHDTISDIVLLGQSQ